jgi:hypothetical protein
MALEPGKILVWDSQQTGQALTVRSFKFSNFGLIPVAQGVRQPFQLGIVDAEAVSRLKLLAASDPGRCSAILEALGYYAESVGAGSRLSSIPNGSILSAMRRLFRPGEEARQRSLKAAKQLLREALDRGGILRFTERSEGIPLDVREPSRCYLRAVATATQVVAEAGILKSKDIDRLCVIAVEDPHRCQEILAALERFGERIKERQRIIQRVTKFTEDAEIASLVERAQGMVLAPTADPEVFSGLGQALSLLESIETRSHNCIGRFPNGFKEQLEALSLSERAKLANSVEGAIRNYDEWIRPVFAGCGGFSEYLQRLEGALKGFEALMDEPAYCRRGEGAEFVASVRNDLAELAKCPRKEDIPTPTTAQELLHLEQHFRTGWKVDEGISALLEAEHRARASK